MRETTRVQEVGPRSGEEPQQDEKRIDLSVPQVAGSAVAAVAGAVAASQLGVYGTVIGAGVMSVVATTGGSVFQHLFRRTGEQFRDVAHVRPKGETGPDVPDTFRADPEPDPLADPAPGRIASADPATAHTAPGEPPAVAEATQLLQRVDPAVRRPGGPAGPAGPEAIPSLGEAGPAAAHTAPGEPPAVAETTQLLRQVGPARSRPGSPAAPAGPEATQLLGRAGPDATQFLAGTGSAATGVPGRPAEGADADRATRLLHTVPGAPGTAAAPGSGDFGAASTHQARPRRWKRPLISAAAVFVLAMGGITGWELISGHALSGDAGPTISNLTGNRSQPAGDQDEDKAPAPEETPSGEAPSDGSSTAPSSPEPEDGTGPTGTPGGGTATEPTQPGQQPGSPDGSPGGDATPTPAPTPSAGDPEQPTGQPSGGVPSGAAPEEDAPAG
ncbi:hypothetical protein Sdia_48770 [Streptomyces diastaticus subsp. diastaticus]|uniref:Uncharacterized protein n=2 Tax=Streptomyces TaxID=1883 RepID=A0A380P4C9_STRGR|nr:MULTISPECIES: hypothetical protein [Streptomyces]WSU35273.1 hypothetical protein OG378_05355 [Streptomyces gougerotii]SUP59727.1 Uncharacterised protein [Streptomyces griseus]GFH68117.1 hypothetical protein Srut_46310 [Streptomyces rutgersensis]GFH74109.1 hypothetical protein Sdia_48770 [Streptomyces diastaticus subsp. diastaticus]GGU43663.1 hypothetical protein GCM10015534_52760 [Streptomyces diastaticus subsp. diastaticus]